MAWQLRHEGSPQGVKNLSLAQVAEGLRDGVWDVTDEALGPGETRWQRIENHPLLAEIVEELETPPPARHEDATSLDMNALIDVCLVLLIFFILTTSYVNAVQKVVPLPVARAAEGKKAVTVKIADVKSRMIKVQAAHDAAGKPVVQVENQRVNVLAEDGQRIDPAKLADALRPYARGEDRKTEVLLVARQISWENAIAIQDGARAVGIQVIHHLGRSQAGQ